MLPGAGQHSASFAGDWAMALGPPCRADVQQPIPATPTPNLSASPSHPKAIDSPRQALVGSEGQRLGSPIALVRCLKPAPTSGLSPQESDAHRMLPTPSFL